VIAFSPVRQGPEVLRLFLDQLGAQEVEVWAYDDNEDPESSKLLRSVRVLRRRELGEAHYLRTFAADQTKRWSAEAIDRVARIKNLAIADFLKTDASHLFLIDSDVLLRPGTVAHLLEAQVPIIAAIYWTSWRTGFNASSSDLRAGPNAFWYDRNTLRALRRFPGHYQIPGTGACTLIERKVLEAGVDFTPTEGKPWGEDRWFCARAIEAGFGIWACNHLTPFHLYTDAQLEVARAWV
jgi:hypothetical protein